MKTANRFNWLGLAVLLLGAAFWGALRLAEPELDSSSERPVVGERAGGDGSLADLIDERAGRDGVAAGEGEAVAEARFRPARSAPLAEPFPFSRLDREGELLEERYFFDPGAKRGKRVRLVESSEFDFPIRVEYALERGEGGSVAQAGPVLEMAGDRALVRVAAGQSVAALERDLELAGVRVVRRLGNAGLLEVLLPERGIETLPLGLGALSGAEWRGKIAYAEPNYMVHAAVLPDDERLLDGSLWGLRNLGEGSGIEDVDIDAPEGWDLRTDASEVVVAVIDSGINYLHDDLRGNLWVNQGEIPGNGIDDDGNGYIDDVHGINVMEGNGDPMDDNGHGTHVAGTIGATANDGLGVVGVAWKVRLLGVKFLSQQGSGSTADAIVGIDYALSMGATVLNNSWGGGSFSQSLRDAIAEAESAGAVFVAAAGNAGRDIDEEPSYPASYDLGNVVSVASVDRRGELSPFSNYGLEGVDLAAPGSDILSTWIGGPQAYRSISGTSMAAPHVSGISALLMAQYPESSLPDTIGRLVHGARSLESLERRVAYGGLANLRGALELEAAARPPAFLQRPERERFVPLGAALRLEAGVSSALPVAYQWFHDDALLEGATGASLELSALELTQSGSYRLEASNADGVAKAWSEVVALEPLGQLSEALDSPLTPVFSYRASAWESYAFDSVVGPSSVRSGAIGDGEQSTFLATVQGPGTVSFFWRLSAEPFWDFGEFRVDGVKAGELRRSGEWEKVFLELDEAREYRLEWVYAKDRAGTAGQDALFVDGLSFSPAGESPPIIVDQPQGALLGFGASYELGVAALGEGLTYQWEKDGFALSGATGATLALSADSEAVSGNYGAVVSNANGSVASSLAKVEVANVAVSIEQALEDAQVRTGETVVLEAAARGSLPVQYQWYRDGAEIAGARDRVLRIEAVQPADAGLYQYAASNAFTAEAQFSREARLEVVEVELAPKVVKDPVSGNWQTGRPLRLSAAVEGSLPMRFQWYKDGVPVAGETERFLERESLGEDDDGVYRLVAENPFGEATSADARVRVLGDFGAALDLPSLEWELWGHAYFFAQSETSFDGEDALQSSPEQGFFPSGVSLLAEVEGPATFSIWWKQEAVGAASRTSLRVDNEYAASLTHARDWHQAKAWVPDGRHSLWIESAIESGSSVWLDQTRLESAPVAFGQSGAVVVEEGDALRLWADVRGAGELEQQWYKDGVELDGETSGALEVLHASSADAGSYELVTRSAFGTLRLEMEARVASDLAGELGGEGVVLDLGGADSWRVEDVEGLGATLRSGLESSGDGRRVLVQVVGPGTLVFDLGIRAEGCCPSVELWVDGELRKRYDDWGSGDASALAKERGLWLGDGERAVEWVFREGRGAAPRSREAFLGGIRLSQAPFFSQHPKPVRVVEGEGAVFRTLLASEGEHGFQWFKDGQAIAGATGATLELEGVAEGDAGAYDCVATNAQGLATRSDSAELVVVTGFLESAGLEFATLRAGGAFWEPVAGEGRDGGPALAFRGSEPGSLAPLAFDVEVPEGERRGIAFWIRIDSLAGGASARVVENGGKFRLFDAETGWQRVVLPLGRSGTNRITALVSRGLAFGEASPRIFLDDFAWVESPLYYQRPSSQARYWGDPFSLSAEVTGGLPMAYRWSADGEVAAAGDLEAGSEVRFVGGKATDRSAGVYELALENGEGSLQGKEGRLALLSAGYGAAVGAPGAAVWSEGAGLWVEDDGEAAVGARSLTVGGLGLQESSDLVWRVRGPGKLSLYWKLDTPSGGYRMGLFVGGHQVNGLFGSSDWVPVELEIDDRLYEVRARLSRPGGSAGVGGRGWVDAIRFEREGGTSFEDWREASFAGSGLSEEDRGLGADPDGDGIPNFAEYALRQDPLRASAVPHPRFFGVEQVAVDFPREAAADDVSFGLEASRDLQVWYPLRSQFLDTTGEGAGSGTLIYFLSPEDLGAVFHVRFAVYYLGGGE